MAVVSGPQRGWRSKKVSTKEKKCVPCPKESRPKVERKKDDARKGGKLKNSSHPLPWPLSTSRDDAAHRYTTIYPFLFRIFFPYHSNGWVFIIFSLAIIARKRSIYAQVE